ncbi:MAG: site-specific DNA-methyltransferase [bacterium]|nr:site-specific DNA-methyltransferase [bacterium]
MADELDALLKRVEDNGVRSELRDQIERLRRKRHFGLVFESHLPERVRLRDHPVRRGSMVVRRDAQSQEAPRPVLRVDGRAVYVDVDGETVEASCEELVVVAEFGDPIYPGLRRLGSISRGGDKPAHVLIKGENYHALEALRFSHAGKVDCIYIDPPYNTGARDWKYDNDYVDGDDGYRHSKWLAFMDRRLRLAKDLLNPDDSVLIVTIDEKEYLHLGMLLEQLFSDAHIQMCSTLINPAGGARSGAFGRSDEYIFFVTFGSAAPQRVRLSREWVSSKGRTHTGNVRWDLLRRSGKNNAARADRPALFYPIYVDPSVPRIVHVGEPLADDEHDAPPVKGHVAVLPIRKDGSEGNWQAQPSTLRTRIKQGRVRVTGNVDRGFTISTLKNGEFKKILRGEFTITGHREDGSLVVADVDPDQIFAVPSTQWRIASHDATQYGTRLLDQFLPDRDFPFPKSLYAVEDAIRFFVNEKPAAVVLDFFAGSGTTLHAIARLNKQDRGTRQCISVTNNEVSADEAKDLQSRGLLPGDAQWEEQGIFEHIGRPRIEAAITGMTPDGEPVKGDYKFTDEFPMADGFDENVEFLELGYLDVEDVELDFAFESVAPLLWLRAGGTGPMIDRRCDESGEPKQFDLTARYGVLFDPDRWRAFVKQLTRTATTVFVVTDSPSVFASVSAELPSSVDAVRLYENYLSTYAINRGR